MSSASAHWQVPNEGHKYLIDVDVLARIHVRKDPSEIYDGLVFMADLGTLKTVRQTFDELKRFGPQFEILKPHRDLFQIPAEMQFDERVSAVVELLGNECSYLWEQTGGKNPDPADPWMVAVAATHGFTVVTNERPKSSMRIPAACRHAKINCRCIRRPHFLVEVGLVKEIKPEHIDPAYFFDEGQ
jgi:hypothetical protein